MMVLIKVRGQLDLAQLVPVLFSMVIILKIRLELRHQVRQFFARVRSNIRSLVI